MADYLDKLTAELLKKESPIQEELNIVKKKIDNINKHKKILVVDDKQENILVLKLLLKSEGYEIFQAKNGLEAVNVYKENPDICKIYMDIRMPVMNGDKASKLIRKFEQENGVEPCTIIAVTAFSEYENTYKESGIDSIILKPVTKEQLLSDPHNIRDI